MSEIAPVESKQASSLMTITPLQRRLGILLLLGLTACWGSTFVIMKLIEVPPAVLMLLRFSIAAVVLLPWVRRDKWLWLAGAELGLWLWGGYATQVVGLQYTTVNRSAFITSLTVIFIPILAAVIGRHVPRIVWIAALVAMIGVGLLSYDGSAPNLGDLWTLATAIIYAAFMVRLERFAVRYPPLPLTAASMWAVVLLSLGWVAIERPAAGHINWLAILYLGIVVTALTTWLQTVVQQWMPAPQVGVIYTMEPVWASLFGYLFAGELLGPRGFAGAAMIVVAAVLCQRPTSSPAAPSPPTPEEIPHPPV